MKTKLKKKMRRWQAAEIMAKNAKPESTGVHNAQLYNAVIVATLAFLDEVTGQDITGNYPVKYDRTTPLEKIGIPGRLRRTLAKAFDDKVRAALIALGHAVGNAEILADDMDGGDVATIQGLYRMACAIYAVPVPKG